MIQACIFDLDGVIVDTAKYHYLAWKRLADQLQIAFSEEENEKMKGISRMASLERLLEIGGLHYNEAEKERFCEIKNNWYLDFVRSMDESEILPGTLELIRELHKNDKKVVLGSASKNARTILDLINMSRHFDAIVDGNDVIKSKPDPEVFLKGADLVNCEPENIVVFEDSAKGIDAAISGGFKTIGIGSIVHLGHADLVVKDLSEMSLELLQSNFNGV